jgi:hypothetical protein
VLEDAERRHTGNSREVLSRLERSREEQGRAGRCGEQLGVQVGCVKSREL